MATWQHLRSSTANKRPTTSLADGRIAINTNTASPGLFFKDSAGTGIVKVGPVHVGTTAPNSVPAAGGSSGNYLGEQWLDTSVSPAQMKVWNGSTWVGIVADELPVSKLQDGAPRQLIQTDAAGTGVEWTSNVDVPGTLDVTSTATFDSIAQYPLGSAGAPTITFTGDNNTGIYSPGADQVAISTGGSGRLFINSSGQVGVGVSPSAPLEVNGEARFTRPGAASQYVGIIGDGADTRIIAEGSSKNLTIKNNSTTSSAIIFDQAVASSYIFNQAGTERLRITSAGLVGIGSSFPGYPLTVNGRISYAGAIGEGADTTLSSSSTTLIVGDSATWQNLALKTNGSNRVYINAAGSVGIGTTAVASILHTSGSSDQAVTIQTTTAGADTRINFRNSAGTDAGGIQYLHNGNHLRFNTNSGERARIDGSGRLLVGTSSARANFSGTDTPQFQVEGNSFNTSTISVVSAQSTGGGNIELGSTGGTTVGGTGTVTTNGYLGSIHFLGGNGTNLLKAAAIDCQVDGAVSGGGAADMPGRLVFSTTADGASSPTERMRINQAGGTYAISTDSIVIALSSTQSAGTTNYLIDGKHSGTAGSVASGTRSFRVFTNGNVENTNNSYAALSDIKLKENIVDAGSQWDDIKALQVRNYNLKEGQTHRQIGLIAQEVEPISPGLVYESPDRDEDGNDLGTTTKSVNYSVLYMKAVKALQEAMERIELLEARLDAANL